MKDRTVPCIYYTYAHGTCEKGIVDVTCKRCKNCQKYRPRKTGRKQTPIHIRRQKDKDRHDNWKKEY